MRSAPNSASKPGRVRATPFASLFLTPTVLLLSAAFKFGLDVVVLGAERILLTLAAALLAAVFTLIIARPLPVDEAG